MQTPPALRKMYPKEQDKLAAPNRNVVRKATFTKLNVGVATPTDNLEAATSSEAAVKLRNKEEEKPESKLDKIKKRFRDAIQYIFKVKGWVLCKSLWIVATLSGTNSVPGKYPQI